MLSLLFIFYSFLDADIHPAGSPSTSEAGSLVMDVDGEADKRYSAALAASADPGAASDSDCGPGVPARSYTLIPRLPDSEVAELLQRNESNIPQPEDTVARTGEHCTDWPADHTAIC